MSIFDPTGGRHSTVFGNSCQAVLSRERPVGCRTIWQRLFSFAPVFFAGRLSCGGFQARGWSATSLGRYVALFSGFFLSFSACSNESNIFRRLFSLPGKDRPAAACVHRQATRCNRGRAVPCHGHLVVSDDFRCNNGGSLFRWLQAPAAFVGGWTPFFSVTVLL